MYENEARALWQARETGGSVAQTDLSAISDVAAGYAAQATQFGIIDKPLGGFKLGATAAPPQKALGLEEPFTGPLLAQALLGDGASVPLSGDQGNFLECEFALVLAGPLPSRENLSSDAILAAIARVHAAIEVVSTRFQGGLPGAGRFLIADNAGNGAVILGDEIPVAALDSPATLSVSATLNGAEGASGNATALQFGGVVEALGWLAARQDRLTRPLAAGDVIMTGSVTGMTPVTSGDKATVDFGGLGSVSVTFT